MTVNELIEQLQNCDLPDAEVFLNGNYGKANGAIVAQRVVPATEVSFSESDGPVYVEGFYQEAN